MDRSGSALIDREWWWRERFYAFERAVRFVKRDEASDDWPLEACATFARALLRDVPMRSLRVVGASSPSGGAGGWCRIDYGHVTLGFPVGRRRPWCVLHEVAHVLTCAEYGHGELFQAVVLDFWRRYHVIDVVALSDLAVAYGIEVAA